jgi:ribosome-binding protein aMBF1 (putative translation factor)
MIGHIIKKARLAREWSQEELGRRLGISDAMVCSMESGRRKVPAFLVRELRRVLGLSRSSTPVRCTHCGSAA